MPGFSFEIAAHGNESNIVVYYDQPSNFASDWTYNEILNEIWALTYESDGSRSVTSIVRINPETKAIIGTNQIWKQFPSTIGAGYFTDIAYNSNNRTVWINSDESLANSYVAIIDAATGVVINSSDGSNYYVANINNYN